MESRFLGQHLLGPWPSTPETKYIWGKRHPQAKQTCPAVPKLRKRKSYSIAGLAGSVLDCEDPNDKWDSHVEKQKKWPGNVECFYETNGFPGPSKLGRHTTHLYSQVCFMLKRPRLERHHQKTPRTGWCLRYPGCTVVRFPALHLPGKVQRQCLTTGLWPRSVVGIWNHQWNRPVLLNSSIRNCLNTLVL